MAIVCQTLSWVITGATLNCTTLNFHRPGSPCAGNLNEICKPVSFQNFARCVAKPPITPIFGFDISFQFTLNSFPAVLMKSNTFYETVSVGL
jgi:hypothetical protein